jgi:tetratricopeptide (TPR) repeat protein
MQGEAEAHRHLGQIAVNRGDIFGGFTEYWLAQSYDPRNRELHDEVEQVQRAINDRVESNGARWHIAAYYQGRVGDPRFLLCGGVRLYAVGDLKDAVRLFEEVAKLYPDCADAYFNLGAVAESEGKLDQALSFYKQALQRSPADPKIQDAIGSVGEIPVVYQGGAFSEAVSRRELPRTIRGTGTCSLCQILRGRMMEGW